MPVRVAQVCRQPCSENAAGSDVAMRLPVAALRHRTTVVLLCLRLLVCDTDNGS